jgi:hypothetical protein
MEDISSYQNDQMMFHERYIKLSKCLTKCYMILYGRFIMFSECLCKCYMMFHRRYIKSSNCLCECYYYYNYYYYLHCVSLTRYQSSFQNV